MSANDKLLSLRPSIRDDQLPPDGPRHDPLPPRYTQGFAVAAIERVARGNFPREACKSLGLTDNDWNAWSKAVQAGTAHPILMQFFDALESAAAVAECSIVEELTSTASTETKLKFLQTRFNQRWAKQEKLIVQTEIDAVVERLHAGLEPELFERVIKLLS